MSYKKRRDITLGEMQDECKKHWNNGNFGYCGKCQYMSACCHYERYCPAQLNLTDPPRFNEAQMAFFRGLHGLGVKKLDKHARNGQPTAFGADGNIFYYDFLDDVEFPLDLAELLGNEKE